MRGNDFNVQKALEKQNVCWVGVGYNFYWERQKEVML